MKTLHITLNKSVGEILFHKTTREEVRNLLGTFHPFESGGVSYDQFDFCHVGYNSEGKADFVCLFDFSNIRLILEGRDLTTFTPLELYLYFQQKDPRLKAEYGPLGFESNSLGVGATFTKEPVISEDSETRMLCDAVDTIAFAVKDYWK